MARAKVAARDRNSDVHWSILKECQKSIYYVTNKKVIIIGKTFKDRKETVSLVLCFHSQAWLGLSDALYKLLCPELCI